MALQVRTVSEPTYEEDGVNYGTPTNMIERIKYLEDEVARLESELSLLSTGYNQSWQEYETKTNDIYSNKYLRKRGFDEYGYYGENNGPVGDWLGEEIWKMAH